MRFHRWRYGIFALAIFLALPVMAEEGDSKCGSGDDVKTYDSATQICLKWFSPEDGKKVYEIFTLPDKSVCPEELECFLVEGEEEVALGSCGQIEQSEVMFKDNQFFVKDFPKAEAYCFEDDTLTHRTYSELKEGNVCKLASSEYLDKRWSEVFLPYEEGKKAEPWNTSTQSYCPDSIKHSEAYDIDQWKEGMPMPELIRRQLLETCSIVVQKYKKACEKKRADISAGIGVQKQNKEQGQEEIKRGLIEEWVSATDCDSANPLKGECLTQWNKIKELKYKVLAIIKLSTPTPIISVDGWEFISVPAQIVENIGLQKAIIRKMIANQKQEDFNKKWISGKLDDFLMAQAESETEGKGKVINETITQENAKLLKVGEVISFLQKRVNNIALSNSLSATKNFNVTSLLRRNTGSIESELTLLGEEKFDRNGNSLNVFNKIIRLVVQVLGSLGVLLLIVSAVMMVVSQGEETMLQKAKQTFLYTIIGLVIAFFSYTIVRFLLELLLLR